MFGKTILVINKSGLVLTNPLRRGSIVCRATILDFQVLWASQFGASRHGQELMMGEMGLAHRFISFAAWQRQIAPGSFMKDDLWVSQNGTVVGS